MLFIPCCIMKKPNTKEIKNNTSFENYNNNFNVFYTHTHTHKSITTKNKFIFQKNCIHNELHNQYGQSHTMCFDGRLVQTIFFLCSFILIDVYNIGTKKNLAQKTVFIKEKLQWGEKQRRQSWSDMQKKKTKKRCFCFPHNVFFLAVLILSLMWRVVYDNWISTTQAKLCNIFEHYIWNVNKKKYETIGWLSEWATESIYHKHILVNYPQ